MDPNRLPEPSDSFVKFAVRTGPMTQEEKEYLIKKGQLLEDSQGELYGEPSTLSFHMSHLANPPVLDDSLTASPGAACIITLADLVESAAKANAEAMAKAPTPTASRLGMSLAAVQELDESGNMEGLYGLADESGIEDNLQLSNIKVFPLSPTTPTSFADSFGPTEAEDDDRVADSLVEPMDLGANDKRPTPKSKWSTSMFTPIGGKQPLDTSSQLNVTSQQDFNTTTGGETVEAIRNLFPGTPVTTPRFQMELRSSNKRPTPKSQWNSSSFTPIGGKHPMDTSSLLVNVTSQQEFDTTTGTESGEIAESIRDLFPGTPVMTPRFQMELRSSNKRPTPKSNWNQTKANLSSSFTPIRGNHTADTSSLLVNVTSLQEFNTTTGSESGEIAESIRNLFPGTPLAGVGLQMDSANKRPTRKSNWSRSSSTPIVGKQRVDTSSLNATSQQEFNTTTGTESGEIAESIRNLFPGTPVATPGLQMGLRSCLKRPAGKSMWSSATSTPIGGKRPGDTSSLSLHTNVTSQEFNTTTGTESGEIAESIRNLFPGTPAATADLLNQSFDEDSSLYQSFASEQDFNATTGTDMGEIAEGIRNLFPGTPASTPGFQNKSVRGGDNSLCQIDALQQSEHYFNATTGTEADIGEIAEGIRNLFPGTPVTTPGLKMALSGNSKRPSRKSMWNSSTTSTPLGGKRSVNSSSLLVNMTSQQDFDFDTTTGTESGEIAESIRHLFPGTPVGTPGLQNKSAREDSSMCPSDISEPAYSDFDDTLSNMERLLAMAEAAEQAEEMGQEGVHGDFEPFPIDLPCSFNEDVLAKQGHGEELQQFEESFQEEAAENSPEPQLQEMVLSPARVKRVSLKELNGSDLMDSPASSPSPASKSAKLTPTPVKSLHRSRIVGTPSPLLLPATEPIFKTPALPGRKTPTAKFRRQFDDLIGKSPASGSPGGGQLMTTPKSGAFTSTPLRKPIPLNLSSPASTIGYPTPPPLPKSKAVGGSSGIPRMGARAHYKPSMSPFLPHKSPLAEAEVHKFASPVADYIYNTPSVLNLKSWSAKARIVQSLPRKIVPARVDGDGKPKVSGIPVRAGSFASTMKYTPQEPRGNRAGIVARSKSPVRAKTPVVFPAKSPARNKTPGEVKPRSPVRNKTPAEVKLRSPIRNKTPGEVKPRSPVKNKTPGEVKPRSPVRNKTPAEVKGKSPARNKTPAEVKAPIIKSSTASVKVQPKPTHCSESPALISFDSPALLDEPDSPALVNFDSPATPTNTGGILAESAGNTKTVVTLQMNPPLDSDEFQRIMKLGQEKEKLSEERDLKEVNYFGSEKLRDGQERTVEAPIISVTNGANPIIILGAHQNKENVLAQRHTGQMSESFGTSIIRSEHIVKSFIPSRVATTATTLKK